MVAASLVTSSGIRLAYDTYGRPDAPPMVLLHALGTSRRSWSPVVPRLAERFRVVAFDLRGHGESDWPGAYSFALMADDLRDAVRQLGLRDVVLVGHSMGGMVGYLLVLADPGNVDRLVIEDAPPPYERDRAVPARPDDHEGFDWAAVPAIVREVNRGDPPTWQALSSISAPTLLIGGGETSHIPQEKLVEVARRIPRCVLRTIPVGHDVHEAAPDEFLAAIFDWLP